MRTETANGTYELRKGASGFDNMRYGKWEVAHFWCDGVTVQVRYFRQRKDAVKYYMEHIS